MEFYEPPPVTGSLVPKGSTLFICNPFVAVVEPDLREYYCDYCFHNSNTGKLARTVNSMDLQSLLMPDTLASDPLQSLLRCSACKFVRYCGPVCQKNAWKEHKLECPGIAASAACEDFKMARMIALIVLKLEAHRGREIVEVVSENRTMGFQDLMSHTDKLCSDPVHRDRVGRLLPMVRKILPEAYKCHATKPEDIFSIYGKIKINSFGIANFMVGREVGSGIYLSLAAVDHACNANAVLAGLGRVLYLQVIEDIVDYSLDKVRISYLTAFGRTKERRKELMDRYFFLCNCSACSDVKRDQQMQSVICGSCGDGAVPIMDDLTVLPCISCGVLLSATAAKTLVTHYMQVEEVTKTFLFSKAHGSSSLLQVNKLLSMQKGARFHPYNLRYLETLKLGMDLSRARPEFVKPYTEGMKQYLSDYSSALVPMEEMVSMTQSESSETDPLEMVRVLRLMLHGKEMLFGPFHPLTIKPKRALAMLETIVGTSGPA